jgi:hypothetical protein
MYQTTITSHKIFILRLYLTCVAFKLVVVHENQLLEASLRKIKYFCPVRFPVVMEMTTNITNFSVVVSTTAILISYNTL